MSTWETVTVRLNTEEIKSISRFTSGDRPEIEDFLEGGNELRFDGTDCWIPYQSVDVMLLRVSDTAGSAKLYRLWTGETWYMVRHDESLWTYDANYGDWQYHEDILKRFPWVQVGGNWRWMNETKKVI